VVDWRLADIFETCCVGTDMKKNQSFAASKTKCNQTVWLQEVGPRDGLQNEPMILKPEVRAKLIESLVDTGLSRIQIGSFVNPRRVPQMAGTDQLWRRLEKKENVRYSVLVLNDKGLEIALAEGIPHIEIYVSASETHSLRNSGVSIARALKIASRVINKALQNDRSVTAGVMCAFGCFYEGPVGLKKVSDIVHEFASMGALEIGLADTAGLGEPAGIDIVLESVREIVSADRLILHLHDTRGNGIANLKAALEKGVRRFDTSLGGLGGCPFIPGAKGNISTEQTVDLLEPLGYRTGVDRSRLDEIWTELAHLLAKNRINLESSTKLSQ
jgi:hydroxymethylglutaryl-CoA lyase